MVRFAFAAHSQKQRGKTLLDRPLSCEKVAKPGVGFVTIVRHRPKVERSLIAKCVIEALLGDSHLPHERIEGSMLIAKPPEDGDRCLQRFVLIKLLGPGHKQRVDSIYTEVEFGLWATRKLCQRLAATLLKMLIIWLCGRLITLMLWGWWD